MSRPQSWRGMFALGLVLVVTGSLSGTVLAESSAVDSAIKVPTWLQQQVSESQNLAVDLLSRLLAGQSIVPEGYVPTIDTVILCYDLVLRAYQASNATLDLTAFINAYVVPYLKSSHLDSRIAARYFLASVVTLQKKPDTFLLQLIVDSGISFLGTTTPDVRSYGNILNKLAQTFPYNPVIQDAVVQFLNTLGGNFESLSPVLWDIVGDLYVTVYQLYPENVVERISVPQFPSQESYERYTYAQRQTLQSIASRLLLAALGRSDWQMTEVSTDASGQISQLVPDTPWTSEAVRRTQATMDLYLTGQGPKPTTNALIMLLSYASPLVILNPKYDPLWFQKYLPPGSVLSPDLAAALSQYLEKIAPICLVDPHEILNQYKPSFILQPSWPMILENSVALSQSVQEIKRKMELLLSGNAHPPTSDMWPVLFLGAAHFVVRNPQNCNPLWFEKYLPPGSVLEPSVAANLKLYLETIADVSGIDPGQVLAQYQCYP